MERGRDRGNRLLPPQADPRHQLERRARRFVGGVALGAVAGAGVADGAINVEAIASALRFYNKTLIIGQPTAGRAAEYSDLSLPGGKILPYAALQ